MRTALAVLLLALSAPAQGVHNVQFPAGVISSAIIYNGRPALVLMRSGPGFMVGFQTPIKPPSFAWQLELVALVAMDSRPCAVGAMLEAQSWDTSASYNPAICEIGPDGWSVNTWATMAPGFPIGHQRGTREPRINLWQFWYQADPARLFQVPCAPANQYPEMVLGIFYLSRETFI